MNRLSSTVLAALALCCGFALPPGSLSAQKALVYCPVGIDTTGCNNIVVALSGGAFPGGVDRAYDGAQGTLALAKVELRSYAVLIVPSLADNATQRPYELLRNPAIVERVGNARLGRVAVWAGTPDQGKANKAGKQTLLQNLARWASADSKAARPTGLVVLQDASEDVDTRYRWLSDIAGLDVHADPRIGVHREIITPPETSELLQEGSGKPLAYGNIATSGLVIPEGTTSARAGGFSASDERQLVLVTSEAGTRAVGRPGVIAPGAGTEFYFLPPLGPDRSSSGNFDAEVSPVVEICVLQGESCASGAPLARFTMGSGTGSERVRRDLEAKQYIVNWHTRRFSLDLSRVYRVTVLANGARLGYADVKPVARGAELKAVPAGVTGVVNKSTLPIKFYIGRPLTGPATRIEIVPGGLLLPNLGASQQLTVRAFDAEGRVTTAPGVQWRSLKPGVVSVSSEGVATAQTIGSAQIVAVMGNLRSAPILALVAQPVAGAVLVSDTQVVGELAAVDVSAPYGLGWRYQVTITGIAPPALGTILLGKGETPIGGRVVAASMSGDAVIVTLQVVPLSEMFRELIIRETIPFEPVSSATPAALGPVVQPSFAAAADEFTAGPFRCEADADGLHEGYEAMVEITGARGRIQQTLTADIDYSVVTGLQHLLVKGSVHGQVTSDALVKAGFDMKLDCKMQLREVTLPIGGPVALFFGAQVPIGVALDLSGEMTLAEAAVKLEASAETVVEMGVRCTSDNCQPVYTVTNNANGDVKLEPWDPLAQFRVKLDAFGGVYADLEVGSKLPIVRKLRINALNLKAGLNNSFDFAPMAAQVNDTLYASDFRTSLLAQAELGESIEAFGDLLEVSVLVPEWPPLEVSLASSPKGTLTISPGSLRATDGEQPGDTATFTISLDPVAFFGSYAVDGVELRSLRTGVGGETELVSGRPNCTSIVPQRSGQTLFTCKTDFLKEHVGEQTFVAFVKAKLFGVPFFLPLEIGGDSRAQITVVGTAVVVENPPEVPLPPDPEGGNVGNSFGDPHLRTVDQRAFRFMGVGDYILSKSTDSADDFEVQVRYRPASGSTSISQNDAVAVRIAGDLVNIFPVAGGTELIIGDETIAATSTFRRALPGGGSLQVAGRETIVSGPDRTMIKVSGYGATMAVSVFLPPSRLGKTEGLLGNYDGDHSNDLRVRNGAAINGTWAELYGDFRQSWRVALGASESLFRRGPDYWDPNFPGSAVTPDRNALENARQTCRNAGVQHPEVVEACAFDVAVMGDNDWIAASLEVDPSILRVTVSPALSYVAAGQTRQFAAVVRGTTSRRVSWTATGGSILVSSENSMTYTAPSEPGSYTITARSAEDNSVLSTATVVVNGAPSVSISSPTNGAEFSTGQTISFSGSASDLEDGTLSGTALVWRSSVSGQIGTGTSFTLSSLAPGAHIITLTAHDSQGATGADNVRISVLRTVSVPSAMTIALSNTITMPIEIADPAPAGGLSVTLTSSDPATVFVQTSTVNIPEGSRTASAQVRGVALGSATIQASATGYAPSASQVLVAKPGTLTGRAVDARTGSAVANATVTLSNGGGSAITASNGTFTVAPLAGIYTVTVATTGFIEQVVNNVQVEADQTTAMGDIVLSPLMGEGEVRIVLTWGASPSDLDSHLTGPIPGSDSRFHIAYFNKGSLTSSPFAALDRDDTYQYGPETITISQQFTGVYRFSVHDFSNHGSLTSSALARSGAKARVYRGSSQIAEFSVPDQTGTLWTVFELNGATLTPVNKMTSDTSGGTMSQSLTMVPAPSFSMTARTSGESAGAGVQHAGSQGSDAGLISSTAGANQKR